MDIERCKRTNPLQWSTFLDYAERNPQILTKAFSGLNAKKNYEQKWLEVSTILNSLGYQQKSVDKWQKAVSDWKSKVKGKAASIKRGLAATGGGGPSCSLNENEQRLLAIIRQTTVVGVVANETGIIQEEIKSELLEDTSPSPPATHSTPCPPPLTHSTPSSPPLTHSTPSPPPLTHSTPSPPPLRPLTHSTQSPPTHSSPSPLTVESGIKKKNIRKKKKTRADLDTLKNFHKESLKVMKEVSNNLALLAESTKSLAEANWQLVRHLERSGKLNLITEVQEGQEN